jgi:citrate lyase gamma subunit
MSNQLKVTTTIDAGVFYKNVAGKAHYLDWSAMPAAMIGTIAQKASLVVLNNAYNSAKGTEEQKLAQALKRFDAWCKGSWEITERASSQATLMREAYLIEQQAKHDGLNAKQLDAKIKETVKRVLGESVNATFDNFLEALATAKADHEVTSGKADLADKEGIATELKARLVAKYEQAAAELEASRADSAKAVDIDLTDFDI